MTQKPSVYRVEWDRDYHAVTSFGYITNVSEVQESWSGYDYSYFTDATRTTSLTEAQARKVLSN